ncbi:MAG TPA: nuclear transport factor 2 family protein [Allosphingosinicella sp.]|nr:nuclear transport factor 2 family protein [Allosphingosinicella sp.]
MRRLGPMLALLAASCGSARERDEQGLRAANAAYDRAIVAGDRAALERILAPDYVYITAEATIRDRAGTIAQLTSGRVRIRSSGSEDVRVRWLGRVAVVTGRFNGEVTAGGRTFPHSERYTSLWTRGDDGWHLRHEHASTPSVGVVDEQQ